MTNAISYTEENYLKAIFSLTLKSKKGASTNDIAKRLETKASSVTDMIKKLAEKGLVDYKKYQGTNLTSEGREVAVGTVRKHRLWEVFLVEKLGFGWDEVHDIAEQLEHIRSKELTVRLDDFLGNPKYDPHGDPIPDKEGNIALHKEVMLEDLKTEDKAVVVGVKDSSTEFLQYLEQTGLVLGAEIEVKEIIAFDKSVSISINKAGAQTVSNLVSKNIYIKKI